MAVKLPCWEYPQDVAIDWNQVIFKGLVIKGIYGREMLKHGTKWRACCSGLDLSPIITHTFSIDDFQKGFDTMGSDTQVKLF